MPTLELDPEELLADVGDRIRAEREARGWSQADLGNRISVRRRTIGVMELGETTFPLANLAAVCLGLGVSLSYLLSEDWQMPARLVEGLLLGPLQVRILREAVSGDPLTLVAVRVGETREVVAARLSEAYRLLGVMHLPQRDRRLAAFRAAEALGLFEAQSLENPVANAA